MVMRARRIRLNENMVHSEVQKKSDKKQTFAPGRQLPEREAPL